MEVTGTVVQLLPKETGQGQNGAWQKQTVVLELKTDGQWTRHLAIDMWNNKIIDLELGDTVTAELDVKSRQGRGEYANRWFTNVNAVSMLREQVTAPPALEPEDDGLPF